MSTFKDKIQNIKKDLGNGTKFSSMIAIEPVSPPNLFVYLFCLEIAKLQDPQDTISLLSIPEIEKNKIRACRWDLLTVDSVFYIMCSSFKMISINELKEDLSSNREEALSKMFPGYKLSTLSLNDLLMVYTKDEVPGLLKSLMANFKPLKKIA